MSGLARLPLALQQKTWWEMTSEGSTQFSVYAAMGRRVLGEAGRED